MHANRDGRLTLQNPFYLNHTQLHLLGIQEVIITPTLLTFAQLQNFYTYTALERNWTDYFWSHQDLVVFALENQTYPDDQLSAAHAATRGGSGVAVRYSLYDRAVGTLQYLRQPGTPRWANHFFAYDHLTLVHRDAIIDVGGWDTHIPFYATDCDMYVRLMWAGYWQGETEVGIIMDVATVLDDVGALLRIPGVKAAFAGDPEPDGPEENREIEKKGESFERLVRIAKRMEEAKFQDGSNALRNTWQLRQTGGQGEPFARDPEGFETGIKMMIDTGRAVFAEKWGHRGCDIAAMGIKAEDAWRLQRDWDIETEGLGYEGDDW
ncbi:hypothetical protein QBC47DRAFT_383877 [Echria macrotheca]|uniref:Uncharacterized protein n=1 Tax=Echria macrotheca TaxID=438768 RepID=A0AAJ0BAS8_9PEZI|nr:hypothetical protein QBC47DRAFT_383877 [Echria macrotheca]